MELKPARITTFYAGEGEVFVHNHDDNRVHRVGQAEAALFALLEGVKPPEEHLEFLWACEPDLPAWALGGYVKHWMEAGLLRRTPD